MSTAYSGTPLARKLGIKQGFKVLLYNQPDHYFKLFADLPEELEFLEEIGEENADFIHVFCTSMEEMERIAISYKGALKKMDCSG